MMYFSRVRIEPGALDRMQNLKILQGDIYAMHQLIWKLFPNNPEAERSFLFRQEFEKEQLSFEETRRGMPIFYLLSENKPVPADGLLAVESKLFAPKLETGMELGFDIRVNPIIARKTEGKNHSVKHDVLMDAKFQARRAGLYIHNPEHRKKIDALVQNAAIEWFAGKASTSGFTVHHNPECPSVEVNSYRKNCLRKRGKEKITFSTVDISGVLKVVDPDVFLQTLKNGLGHSRSFGCGLMLIRKS